MGNKMRIGILTFHEADNYGAVLQAYALRRVISELGDISDEVEVLDYHQPYIASPYRIFPLLRAMNILDWTKSALRSLICLKPKMAKKRKFNEFRKQWMQVSETRFNPRTYKNVYDAFVAGSDQIWNGNITRFDSTYFLDFCKYGEKRIAYAASIGSDTISQEECDFLSSNIKYLDCISVREKQMINYLEDISGKRIAHVLDPTLLLPREKWENVCSEWSNEKMLLIYQLGGNDELLKTAVKIAKEFSLKIMIIRDSIRKVPRDFYRITQASPSDFLALFRDAEFIVTDSFHGTAFAVNFRKNFVTIPNKKRGNRMRSLLELIELESRMIENSGDITAEFSYVVDYAKAEKLLEAEREKSIAYLKRSIFSDEG